MSSSPDNSPRRRRPWDAWILMALAIGGLMVLVLRRENSPPAPSQTVAPEHVRAPAPVAAAESFVTEKPSPQPRPAEIASSPARRPDTPRVSPPFFRERCTADPTLKSRDSLFAHAPRGGPSFLPSGVMVTPPGTDVMVWVPLEASAPPDSDAFLDYPAAFPGGKNTSVTDCLRAPPR
ncbi:MAG: hypothetical protein PHI18_00500 [bacterium]|nr:hypothetical protein [bacterium]